TTFTPNHASNCITFAAKLYGSQGNTLYVGIPHNEGKRVLYNENRLPTALAESLNYSRSVPSRKR
ncbi:unnamed protein product, partial [Ilex paraguariensis]